MAVRAPLLQSSSSDGTAEGCLQGDTACRRGALHQCPARTACAGQGRSMEQLHGGRRGLHRQGRQPKEWCCCEGARLSRGHPSRPGPPGRQGRYLITGSCSTPHSSSKHGKAEAPLLICIAGQGRGPRGRHQGRRPKLRDQDAAGALQANVCCNNRYGVLQGSAHTFLFRQAAVGASCKGPDSRHIVWPTPAERRHRVCCLARPQVLDKTKSANARQRLCFLPLKSAEPQCYTAKQVRLAQP